MDAKQIESLVAEWLKEPSLFLVEVKIDHNNKVTVLLDSDSGVSLDQCISLTRFIESKLDRDVEDYDLTVSSYGLTQPLIMDRQLKKYQGKMVDVTPSEGNPFKATLVTFDNNSITFEKSLTKRELKEGVSPTIHLTRESIRKITPHISFS